VSSSPKRSTCSPWTTWQTKRHFCSLFSWWCSWQVAVPFAWSAFRAAVLTLLSHGRDPQRGSQIVMTAVQRLLGDFFSQMLGKMPPSEKAAVSDIQR
jgi:hypothetical protein